MPDKANKPGKKGKQVPAPAGASEGKEADGTQSAPPPVATCVPASDGLERSKTAPAIMTEKKPVQEDWWWKCGRCREGAKAKVFCVDCPKGKKGNEQFYCHRCCAIVHDWDTNNRFHSIEAIDPKQTTSTIAALVDALLLPLAVIVLLRNTGIPRNYTDGADICPSITGVRRTLFSFDSSVSTYLTTEYFAPFCSFEDGYFRLWLDTFVRGVVTNTDSFFLLGASVFRAYAHHRLIIRTLFVPLAAFLHAVIMIVFSAVLEQLPADPPLPACILDPFKNLLTQFADWFEPKAKRAPKTFWRERPSQDFKETLAYMKSRLLRQFTWRKGVAQPRLEAFSWLLILIPVVIRLCSMLLKMRWIFHKIAEVVVPNSFWKSPNIDFDEVTKDVYTGTWLEAPIRRPWRAAMITVPDGIEILATIGSSVVFLGCVWVVRKYGFKNIIKKLTMAGLVIFVVTSTSFVFWLKDLIVPEVILFHTLMSTPPPYLAFNLYTVFGVWWTFLGLWPMPGGWRKSGVMLIVNWAIDKIVKEQQGKFKKEADKQAAAKDWTDYTSHMIWEPKGRAGKEW